MTPDESDATAPYNDDAYLMWAINKIRSRLNDPAAEQQYLSSKQPSVYMEAPTPQGNKFWQATAYKDFLELKWGPVGRAGGDSIEIPEDRCQKNGGILGELFRRATDKLNQGKGYRLLRGTCHFPLP